MQILAPIDTTSSIELAAQKPKPPKPGKPAPGPVDPAWVQVGALQDARLNEVSGMAVSQAREGVRWLHNDSGDAARVFAIDGAGQLVQEVRVDGARAIDWEDMAVGPGRGGEPSVYVADIGDNLMLRRSVQLYRFAEPAAGLTSTTAERIELRYPDGRARNAETVLVDPRSGDVVVVTKVAGGRSELFRASKDAVDSGRVTLEAAGVIEVAGLATGGAVSADGSRIAVRTYEQLRVWERAPGESLAAALLKAPSVTVSAPGPQSEAITFSEDGRSVLSVSEGVGQPIYRRPV